MGTRVSMVVSGGKGTEINMRRSLLIGLMTAWGFAVLPVMAQGKFGVINLQKALLETADMKKASGELEAKYKPKTERLAQLQKDLNEIQVKLQNPQTPANTGADLQADGTRKQREATRIQEDLQGDLEKDRNEILQRGAGRMTEVVKKLAEEKGFDLVVDVTTAIFYKPATEFTADATAAYDKAYAAK